MKKIVIIMTFFFFFFLNSSTNTCLLVWEIGTLIRWVLRSIRMETPRGWGDRGHLIASATPPASGAYRRSRASDACQKTLVTWLLVLFRLCLVILFYFRFLFLLVHVDFELIFMIYLLKRWVYRWINYWIMIFFIHWI